ncbi:MAG: hypothetical protein AB4368_27725 [Xenococcaceae cyanobacterium]
MPSGMMLAFTIFGAATEAKAQIPAVQNSPPPGTTEPHGSPQRIEGVNTILNNRILGSGTIFNLSPSLPSTVIGSGDLVDITQTALDVWTTAFPNQIPAIEIGVGFADFKIDPNITVGDFVLVSPDGILSDVAAFYTHADDNFPDANYCYF